MKIRPLHNRMEITPEILQSCRNDDRKAINALYEHCFRILMPICFRYNNNEEDARASCNAGFLKVLIGLKKVDDSINFNAWSKRIMVNTLIDEYRKDKTYKTKITKSDNERELDYFSKGTENEAESNLGCENILLLVKQLPSTTGIVFNLYVIEGYSHKEIGERIGISEGTSKWHLSTARKALREKLEQIENENQRLVI